MLIRHTDRHFHVTAIEGEVSASFELLVYSRVKCSMPPFRWLFGISVVLGSVINFEVRQRRDRCAVIRSGDATVRFWVCAVSSRDVLECARVAHDLSARR
jgi:hypothetical protein